MLSAILIIVFTIAYIAGGTYYRYWVVRAKFELGYYLLFMFVSYSAALGTVYFLGGLDFGFNQSRLLGYELKHMIPVIFIGSLGALAAGGILWFILVHYRGNLRSLVKGPKKPKKKK
jgi:hypothetical protein